MKKIRVVCYAINGRGMGHLVRQLAIARNIRRLCAIADCRAEIWVLTSSEGDTLARREGFPSLKMPSKAMMKDAGLSLPRYLAIARSWVLNSMAALQPDLLIVDTFPGGSFGELLPVIEMAPRRVLVAREVRESFAKEESYQALLPLYHEIIEPNQHGIGPIMIRHHAEQHSRDGARKALGVSAQARVVYLSVGGGGEQTAEATFEFLIPRLRAAGFHVVVGAGPLYQGEEWRGEGVTWLDRYVPMSLFPGFDAAVSAGGYNSFNELMYSGVPTVFLPLERIADDQLARVKRAEEAGAGRVAADLDAVVSLLADVGSLEAARTLVPDNGATRAALSALSGLLDGDLLRRAAARLSDANLRALARLPRVEHEADALRLLAHGVEAEGGEAVALEPLIALFARLNLPAERGLALVQAVMRTFPQTSGEALNRTLPSLFDTWSCFDDWMGVTTLLRALPTQRQYSLEQFTEAQHRWLARESDLFEAVRTLSRFEAEGLSLSEAMEKLGPLSTAVPSVRSTASGDTARPAQTDVARAKRKKAVLTGKAHVLEGMRQGRPLLGPQTVHIDITNTCNAKCITCWDHSPLLKTSRPIEWKRKSLSLERFGDIIEQLEDFGSVKSVILSGMGDPFVHPDIAEMIRMVKHRGWHLTVLSNLVAADIDALEAVPDQVLAGVHGVTPATYAAFHPGWGEGEFFKLCAALRALQRRNVTVRHVQVINRDNAHEVEAMVRFGKLFGAERVNFKLASLTAGTEACAIDAEQLEGLRTSGLHRIEAVAEASGVKTNLPQFRLQLEAAQRGAEVSTDMADVGCFMGYVYTRITVEQDVLFCCNTETKVGNLEQASLKALWEGPAWQAMRDALRRGQYFEGCDRCGKFEQNMKWGERVRSRLGEEVFSEMTGGGAPATLLERVDVPVGRLL